MELKLEARRPRWWEKKATEIMDELKRRDNERKERIKQMAKLLEGVARK